MDWTTIAGRQTVENGLPREAVLVLWLRLRGAALCPQGVVSSSCQRRLIPDADFLPSGESGLLREAILVPCGWRGEGLGRPLAGPGPQSGPLALEPRGREVASACRCGRAESHALTEKARIVERHAVGSEPHARR